MPKTKTATSTRATASHALRIIGGEWRGRKLSFTPQEGLRPTLDRYRETLFNWLMFDVEGSRCLDLFAGSGALGLEALSRGARECVFVDTSRLAAEQISQHLKTLKCERGRVFCKDGRQWLQRSKVRPGEGFDLVFLDPPFHGDLLNDILAQLFAGSYINDLGYIYIEAEAEFTLPPLPGTWQLSRQKSAKNKVFFLIKKMPQS